MKTTEKDIRKFFKSNSPVLSDSQEFIAGLRRQFDLLPTPSALSDGKSALAAGKSDEEIKSALDLAARTAVELKRQFRFRAVVSTLVGIPVAFAALLVLSAITPEILSALTTLLPSINL